MLYLGCHLSSADGVLRMGETALQIGANTFAFFTRNPRGGKAKEIDPADAAALRDLCRDHDFGPLVAHAPYTLNPCSDKERVREFARLCMREDLERMEHLPGNFYNFHPGSHVGQGRAQGIRLIVELLNDIIRPDQSTIVLLETMAGKGSEIGGSFEELKTIIDQVRYPDRIGVCMDSCHISDAGYDIIGDLDGVLEEFDRIIGLDKLHALHVNDSKNPPGSRKDRHAPVGGGEIGEKAIMEFVHHPRLAGLPCVLETPNDLEGYAREIALLRSE